MTKLNKHLPLIALCFGFFMVIIDVTIVNVALPNMARGLGGGVSWLQWVVDGYTLTFACLLLSAGNLADQLGAKTIFLWGLACFVCTSIGCGLANSFWLLTIFRLLQGIAAAFLVPTSLALINSAYDNNKERAKAIGIWAGVGGIAAAAGPILGAVLTTLFSWRAVFFVNVPIGIVGLLLTIKYVPNPVVSGKKNFDIFGQIFGIISIAALAFSLIEAGRMGWLSNLVISSFVIFLISFIAFLITEYRVATPMFPLKFFRSKNFSIGVIVGMILNVSIYGEIFVLSLYFQQVRDYSVLVTGFAFMPLLGIIAIASYLGGRTTSALGAHRPMLIGLVIGACGFFAMLITNQYTPYILLILPLIAMGFGIAFTMPAATVAVMHAVSKEKAGVASGTLNTSRQVGSLIGVAIFGTLLTTSHNFISGMHITLIIGGVAFLCGALLTFAGLKSQ